MTHEVSAGGRVAGLQPPPTGFLQNSESYLNRQVSNIHYTILAYIGRSYRKETCE